MDKFCPFEARRTATSRHRYGVKLSREALEPFFAHLLPAGIAEQMLAAETDRSATFYYRTRNSRDQAARLAIMLVSHKQGVASEPLRDVGIDVI